MNEEQKSFYEGLEMSNAASFQQANNNLLLATTSALTDCIQKGADSEKIAQLMEVMKSLKELKN